MRVRYRDALSRRCDGVLAQLDQRPSGPTYSLFSEHFLARLLAASYNGLTWREVEIVNPTKTTPNVYEIVESEVHSATVALRGGRPDLVRCPKCRRHSDPHYPLVGGLPTWLNPWADDKRRQQPDLYVGAMESPRSPQCYTIGSWQRGVRLAVTDDRLWAGRKPGTRLPGLVGMSAARLGVVAPSLVAKTRKRAV